MCVITTSGNQCRSLCNRRGDHAAKTAPSTRRVRLVEQPRACLSTMFIVYGLGEKHIIKSVKVSNAWHCMPSALSCDATSQHTIQLLLLLLLLLRRIKDVRKRYTTGSLLRLCSFITCMLTMPSDARVVNGGVPVYVCMPAQKH